MIVALRFKIIGSVSFRKFYPSVSHRYPQNSINTANIPFMSLCIIAELPRAEGARAEPRALEILVNLSSRENLVMTSPYERASERRPYRLWGRGRGASRQRKLGNRGMPSFFGGIFKEKKTHFYLSCQQMIAEVDLTF